MKNLFSGKFSATTASDSHQAEHEVVEWDLTETDGKITGNFRVGFGSQYAEHNELNWVSFPLKGVVDPDSSPDSAVRLATLTGEMNCHAFRESNLRCKIGIFDLPYRGKMKCLIVLKEDGSDLFAFPAIR
jgi:hypothetical protein